MGTNGFMELHGIELLTQDVERLVNFYLTALNASREDAHGGPDRIEIVLNNSRLHHCLGDSSIWASMIRMVITFH